MHSEITWDELLEEYFFAHRLRPATEWSYNKVVRGFRHYSGDIQPAQITHRQVLEWRRYLLQEKQQSAQTWNNKIAHLRALYNYGMEHEILPPGKNPFNKSNVQRGTRKKKTLTRSQLIRVYLVMQQFEEAERAGRGIRGGRNALWPAWYWLTVLDAFRYTGMRLNQLLHIQLGDINLSEGYLDLCLEGSKTHREWRVPIVSALKPRLNYLIEKSTELGAGNEDYLFDVNRIQLKRHVAWDAAKVHQKIRSFFRRLSKECGFTVSPHRFRHTLATELMKSPERNLQLVKDLLGHRSVSTTMEYVELKMDIVGKTLEAELSLHTDVTGERNLHLLTQA
ncbi:TPA: tyrosine-type recombinase/integrase [Raoultella ornithinolytica]|uniref:tyrosine-type recombinase/integrase n=1 Tax=Raoultella ornithinolytica TaxID=54291 RepID=UPI000E5961E3|nr:site-specific integrase [Raoultella ornithinolytica]KAB8156992.1 tyrosine-type recombinase/integrase [Raoultella ornithinolytica]KAB8166200.1 tyrosine-type recombinase/integrase [Raoultella ornithinolytica]QWU10978.1 tyrosine-type recombinase/integrase [Raoultella ornithinolytica]HCI9483938.1 site-specific integrase [Raoultella ornithinolytica]